MTDLKPVPEDVVRQAVRGADLVVLKGRAVDRAPDARGRALWSWPSGGGDVPAQDGDWYLFRGGITDHGRTRRVPVDSFPPAVPLTAAQPTAGMGGPDGAGGTPGRTTSGLLRWWSRAGCVA